MVQVCPSIRAGPPCQLGPHKACLGNLLGEVVSGGQPLDGVGVEEVEQGPDQLGVAPELGLGALN